MSTPKHYKLHVAGQDIEVNDITKGLSSKMGVDGLRGGEGSGPITGCYAQHKYFAAVEYLLRAPFKGQEKEDIRKCISVLEEMLVAPQYQRDV